MWNRDLFSFDLFFSACCHRWKGENVATSEVADILTMVPCILEANVYGVKVEGNNTDVRNSPRRDVTPRFTDLIGMDSVCLAYALCVCNWFVWTGHEGRIGMAAVILTEGEDFDCSGTYKQVVSYLPAYARPRFIRIQVKTKKRICWARLCFLLQPEHETERMVVPHLYFAKPVDPLQVASWNQTMVEFDSGLMHYFRWMVLCWREAPIRLLFLSRSAHFQNPIFCLLTFNISGWFIH